MLCENPTGEGGQLRETLPVSTMTDRKSLFEGLVIRVKYELAKDVKLSRLKAVQVDTHRGEVTLNGNVHTQEQKKHDDKIAS
jgi:hypothetical protein